MIKVKFNDVLISLENNLSLAQLLILQDYVELHFAVAINRRFIARSQYSSTFLQEGDLVEVVSPMQGG